jgi:hypothetical protein
LAKGVCHPLSLALAAGYVVGGLPTRPGWSATPPLRACGKPRLTAIPYLTVHHGIGKTVSRASGLLKNLWVAVPYYSERGGQVPESETDPPRLRLYHVCTRILPLARLSCTRRQTGKIHVTSTCTPYLGTPKPLPSRMLTGLWVAAVYNLDRSVVTRNMHLPQHTKCHVDVVHGWFMRGTEPQAGMSISPILSSWSSHSGPSPSRAHETSSSVPKKLKKATKKQLARNSREPWSACAHCCSIVRRHWDAGACR